MVGSPAPHGTFEAKAVEDYVTANTMHRVDAGMPRKAGMWCCAGAPSGSCV